MNDFDARLFGETFVTLLVIVDPLGTVPIFLGLTGGRPAAAVSRIARQAAVVSLLVIISFAVFGQQILGYLGITLAALQCAGGLLLLLVALELLTGESDKPASSEVNIALVPLGTPLLAGPGAIVATMVFAKHADRTSERLAVAAGIVAVHAVLFLVLRFSAVILRVIRESGVVLVTRISGLLLSAIAVQLVADAVRTFIKTG